MRDLTCHVSALCHSLGSLLNLLLPSLLEIATKCRVASLACAGCAALLALFVPRTKFYTSTCFAVRTDSLCDDPELSAPCVFFFRMLILCGAQFHIQRSCDGL